MADNDIAVNGTTSASTVPEFIAIDDCSSPATTISEREIHSDEAESNRIVDEDLMTINDRPSSATTMSAANASLLEALIHLHLDRVFEHSRVSAINGVIERVIAGTTQDESISLLDKIIGSRATVDITFTADDVGIGKEYSTRYIMITDDGV
jgi:hypothetical protein